jgi:two-component system cell cycle response regulator
MPKARVLAVDDQRYFREAIEGLLSEAGYSVQTAPGAKEALHALEREPFDIVLTDLVMPGVDGAELVRQIKQRLPEQEIVMVTGVVDVKTAVEAMKQGATDYILKPFEPQDLTSALERILQRRRLREEHARLMAENLEYMGVLSLYERAIGLFSTTALQPLADRLIESLCLETRAQGGVLWIVEELGESRLALVGARGLIRVEDEPRELVPGSLGEEFEAEMNEGRSVAVPRTEGDGQGAALFVPVRFNGELLGVARLSDPLDGGNFGDHARAGAEKFMAFGTSAIVNALRFRALERRSFRDPTTLAYTGAYFKDAVRNEIPKARRYGRPFSLMQIVTGPLGDLRRRSSDNQFNRWVQELVEQLGIALRGTDLLASEGESRYIALLPETDAVGASVVKQRLCDLLSESDLLEGRSPEERIELVVVTASYPGDGTQLESLERVLDERVEEHRASLLRGLELAGQTFSHIVDALVDRGEAGAPEIPAEIARFVIDEVERRPRDRGLLFVSPGARMQEVVCAGLQRLQETENRTEIVLVDDDKTVAKRAGPVTWVTTGHAGTACPFLVYYGDGPAYAMVVGDKQRPDGVPFFHTADRALVEQLAFQLQRDLGLSLGAPS